MMRDARKKLVEMMDEKKLSALGEIQRALGMLEGFSCAVDKSIAAGIEDAVAIIDEALKEVLGDG
jgi:hypothetical protein